MEVLVTLGRDYVVAYQNQASASIEAMPVGVVDNQKDVSDSVHEDGSRHDFRRQDDSVVRTGLLFRNGRALLLTRDYRPRCWGEMAKLSA